MRYPRLIYKISNLNNGKIYIGSSCDPSKRFSQHISQLNYGTHPVEDFQTDYNNGEKCLKFEIIDVINNPSEDHKEYDYMKEYSSNIRAYGYNYKDKNISHHDLDKISGLSKKEKDIIKNISEALPKMDDFDKGYFLGFAESMVRQKRKEGKETEDAKDNTKT